MTQQEIDCLREDLSTAEHTIEGLLDELSTAEADRDLARTYDRRDRPDYAAQVEEWIRALEDTRRRRHLEVHRKMARQLYSERKGRSTDV